MRKKKLQVFVSSTFMDLKEERQAAVQAILKIRLTDYFDKLRGLGLIETHIIEANKWKQIRDLRL